MKKSLLALAVLGAFAGAAQAQSSVTIYGIVDTGLAYTSKAATGVGNNTGSKFEVKSGVIQGSRIGFKGTEDLGGGLAAVFNLEAGFSNDDGTFLSSQSGASAQGLFRRKSVVGFTGNFGQVFVGRQTDFTDDIGLYNSVKTMAGMVNNSGLGLNRTEGVRVNNSVRFNSLSYSGFRMSAIYGFGEQADSNARGQTFGIGGMYENGPFVGYLNYFQSKASLAPGASGFSTASDAGINSNTTYNTAANAGKTAYKSFIVGGSYQAGPARLYADWSRTFLGLAANPGAAIVPGVTGWSTAYSLGGTANNKTDTYDLGVDYSLTAPLHLLAAFQYSKVSYVGTAPTGKVYQGTIGVDYFLSKRTDVYAFAAYMKAKNAANQGIIGNNEANNNNANQTAVAVGVRHRF